MEKKTFDSKQYTDYEDRFQYFIALAVIALITEQLIGNRKSHWVKKLKLSASDEA
jgi:Ca-activated chloride channel family protein